MNANNNTTSNTEEFKYFTTMDTIVHEILNSDDFVHNIVKEVKKATKKAAKKATKKATKKAAKKAAKKAVKKAIKRNNVAEKALEMMYDPMTTEDAIATTKEFKNMHNPVNDIATTKEFKNMYNPVEDAIATVKEFENMHKHMTNECTTNNTEKKAEVKYSMTGEKVDYDDNVEW